MLGTDTDQSLLLFRRQYLQLFEPDFLVWPSPKLLRAPDAQAWLHKHLFDETRTPRLPPRSYQARVLEFLISRIERAIGNEGDEVRGPYSLAILASIGISLMHLRHCCGMLSAEADIQLESI